jgi:hypothetical protein
LLLTSRQRHIDTGKSRVFAIDILADSWRDDSTPIRLDANGRLRDGLHRCAAVLLADKAFQVRIVRG